MNRPSSQYEYMSLDDFEELLPDKPGRAVSSSAQDLGRSATRSAFRLPAIEFEMTLAEIYRDAIAG
ncbi:hypothetical protein [Methylocystis sp.]|uniref:hypothetical protein n=1 Tax=Methylocystis sp. TaxID=1911079 RepID=UPI003DA6532B